MRQSEAFFFIKTCLKQWRNVDLTQDTNPDNENRANIKPRVRIVGHRSGAVDAKEHGQLQSVATCSRHKQKQDTKAENHSVTAIGDLSKMAFSVAGAMP